MDWGAIGGAGYLADHARVVATLEKQGVRALALLNVLGALDMIVRNHPVQIAAMDIDWLVYLRNYSARVGAVIPARIASVQKLLAQLLRVITVRPRDHVHWSSHLRGHQQGPSPCPLC